MNKQLGILLASISVLAGLIWLYLTYGAASGFIITQVRLPRLMLTILTGTVLAGTGYAYQVMLNNPLAEPYILGISSGAAFGSILAAVTGLVVFMPLFGFAGALVTMMLVWSLSHWGGYFNSTKLLLSGIIVGMFFSALISLLMYFNQQDIGNIINVLMGNLGHIFGRSEWRNFLIIFFVSLALLGYLMSLSRQLIIISTGDLMANSLGVDVRKIRRRIFLISSLLTGITVAYAGIIGFIGLVIPHLTRMINGGNRRYTMFQSAFLGASLLLICDFVAQHIAVIEIPVGIITAFIGCPFFIYVMMKSK